MSEEVAIPTGEATAPTPQVAEVSPEQTSVSTGTTEPAAPVAESDEQKAERLLKQKQIREDRARRKVQERISELVEERNSERRQKEQLLNAYLGRQEAPQKPADAAPVRESFADYESFLEAKAEWKAQQSVKATLAEYQRHQQQREQQQSTVQQTHTVVAEFQRKQTDFAKQFPDYEQVVLKNEDVELPNEALALITQIPDGHAAAYAIGKNPELAAQLWGKSPLLQAALLGQWAASVKSKPPQVSTAPAPSQPVASRAAPTSDPSDSDSIEAWIKKREAQLRKG